MYKKPSNKAQGRNYTSDKKYQSSPAQIKKRSQRNAARAKMIDAGKAYVGDGRDIDHKMGLAAGNGAKNLRSTSKHSNRAYPRTPSGKQRRKK